MFRYPRVLENKTHALKSAYSTRIEHLTLISFFFSIKFSNNLVTNSLMVCIMANSIKHQKFFAKFQCSTYSNVSLSSPDSTST